ncbi:hypothetical protein CGC21_17775 [Leishmania donovani]|uniref:Uncharacterized protein n=1 Tax=Leishmania donovani TaxID=5661 RepID=A0A504Y0Z4_LEIDO|nr:hypothetical protein CGC21_17775 [Leishmania donovani]
MASATTSVSARRPRLNMTDARVARPSGMARTAVRAACKRVPTSGESAGDNGCSRVKPQRPLQLARSSGHGRAINENAFTLLLIPANTNSLATRAVTRDKAT